MTSGSLFLLFLGAMGVARVLWTKEHHGSNSGLGLLIYRAWGISLVLVALGFLLPSLNWPWAIHVSVTAVK